MTEHDDVIQTLRTQGALAGLVWAYHSATERTLGDFSEAAGHTASWLGFTRFTLLSDRMDRVFSCRKYSLHAEASPNESLDLLHAELTKDDIDAMPQIDSALVQRADLKGSPGWVCGQRRFLIASFGFGEIDEISWSQKSPTKQRVAHQQSPDSVQEGFFDDLPEDERNVLVKRSDLEDLGFQTLVIAHSLQFNGTGSELYLGRPRFNIGGGNAWHWRENLLTEPPPSQTRQNNDPIDGPTSESNVEDAPVRLRRQAGIASVNRVNGKQ